MKLFVATLVLLFGVPQGVPRAGTGTIEGKVLRESSGQPVHAAEIMLIPAPQQRGDAAGLIARQQLPPGTTVQMIRTPEGNTQIIQTTPGGPMIFLSPDAAARLGLNPEDAQPVLMAASDADGRFVFESVIPGVYTLRAQRRGYLGPRLPQGAYPNEITRSITVRAGDTTKVELGLLQAGVLRGTIRDPDGQPAPNYALVAARPAYTNSGRAIWAFAGTLNTDDRGEYRWTGLWPGEYYLGAGTRAPGPIVDPQDSWIRVFYPGVLDASQARPVTLPEGGEVTVDLSFQTKSRGTVKITGRAVNPLPNLTPDPVTGAVNRAATFVLMPLDLTPLENPPVSSRTNMVATNARPNGDFVLSNVDPGRYELYAMAEDVQNRRIWTGRARVDVDDKDIVGLNIQISPGVTLQGDVVITGAGTLGREAVRIQLQALGLLPPQVANAIGTVSVDASGKFQIDNLSEGRYRMNVQVPSPAYVASIQQSGVNVFDDGIYVDAKSAQLPVRIEIHAAGETVEGDVRVSQKEAPGAVVVLVPEPARRNNPALYRTTIADEKGHFILRGVAPGAYTAFAWKSVVPFAYQNAEFLERYQNRGQSLNVRPGSGSQVQLELIP